MAQQTHSEVLETGRRGCVALLGTLVMAVAWPAAGAELYRGEKGNVNLDTTLTMGVGLRVAERDDKLVFKGNDPSDRLAGSTDPLFSNSDDGNLNYDQFDIYSANAKATIDLEANYYVEDSVLTDVGAFLRMNAFYDVIGNCGHCTRRTPLSSEARHSSDVIDGGVVGAQFLVLDAYADARFDVLDRLIDVRFGNQVISWGESLFIQGGISATNAFDVAKIRVPGAELKEAFIPAPILRVNADIIENLGFEAYYQFHWNRTQIDPVGSYFATTDLMGRGATELFFGNDAGSGCPRGLPIPPVLDPANCETNVFGVPKIADDAPSNQGQGGVSLRYYWDGIQTEFGAYYMRYHNKIPYSGMTAAWLFGPFGQPTAYFRDYAEDIDLVGGSFATTLMNIAFQGEISYRPKDAVPIVASGLAIEKAVAAMGVARQSGYVREKRLQAQMSFVGNLSSSTRWGAGYIVRALAANDIQILGEVAVIHYPGLARRCIERAGGLAPVGPQPCIPYAGVGTSDGTLDATSAGFNVLTRITYADPFGIPITLTPTLGWSKDFAGTTPNQTFIDGRQAVTLGLELDYLQVWGFKASYANFLGANHQNLSRDRDFFAMSMSYSF